MPELMNLTDAIAEAGRGGIIQRGNSWDRWEIGRMVYGGEYVNALRSLGSWRSTWTPAQHLAQDRWHVAYTAADALDHDIRDWRDCAECGDDMDIATGDYYYCDDCGYRCFDCGDCDQDDYGYDRADSYGVHSWDYKPEPYMPKGNYPAEALLGIELEVGGTQASISNAVRSVDDSESHLYMKDDGSISGVEIVTHPATLAWTRTFPFTELLDTLRRSGNYVDDGYGLHIHVSRNAFRRKGQRSAPHQMAWLMFMYRNAYNLQLLARRSESRWAKFGRPRRGELVEKAIREPYSDDRYVAVNCNNRRTYELRFFKSTLSPVEFYAAVEFADASVEYTRGIKTPDILQGTALTWEHFRTWVDAHDYPHLSTELADVAVQGDQRFYA